MTGTKLRVRRLLLRLRLIFPFVTLAGLMGWWLPEYPLSEVPVRGGHTEYLRPLNVTVTIWSNAHGEQGRVLLFVHPGDQTAGKGGLMRFEHNRVNSATLVFLGNCNLDARAAKVKIDNGEIVIHGSVQELVVQLSPTPSVHCRH